MRLRIGETVEEERDGRTRRGTLREWLPFSLVGVQWDGDTELTAVPESDVRRAECNEQKETG